MTGQIKNIAKTEKVKRGNHAALLDKRSELEEILGDSIEKTRI